MFVSVCWACASFAVRRQIFKNNSNKTDNHRNKVATVVFNQDERSYSSTISFWVCSLGVWRSGGFCSELRVFEGVAV